MPKIAKELTALEVKRLNAPGWHAVGGVAGLLLQVRPPAQPGAAMPRSWILRLRTGGQRQPVGLGSYPQVSLAEARVQAKTLSAEAKSGVNLLARKHALVQVQVGPPDFFRSFSKNPSDSSSWQPAS